jgi:hypothetical protein
MPQENTKKQYESLNTLYTAQFQKKNLPQFSLFGLSRLNHHSTVKIQV